MLVVAGQHFEESQLLSLQVPGLWTPEELSKELATLDAELSRDHTYQVLVSATPICNPILQHNSVLQIYNKLPHHGQHCRTWTICRSAVVRDHGTGTSSWPCFYPLQGPQDLYSYFLTRLRRNLRVVVSMDHASSTLSARLRSSPALLNACTVQWWPGPCNNSLRALALPVLTVGCQHAVWQRVRRGHPRACQVMSRL